MSEPTAIEEELELQPVSKRGRNRARWLGCLLLFPIWLVVMLIPCFFVTLAFQEQITILQGDAPAQMIRIWLINEADHRGLGISYTSAYPTQQEDSLCIQTDVRFILWAGQSEPTSYCECYTRSEGNDSLELMSTNEGVCLP
jgi:hypothetical protein